jgi:hypothetical protein
MIIPGQFGFNCPSGFRESFWNIFPIGSNVKLSRINHWKVLYKLCFFVVDRNSKMTTTAGHSFYIGLIGPFYNQVNDTGSWEPLVYLLIRSKNVFRHSQIGYVVAAFLLKYLTPHEQKVNNVLALRCLNYYIFDKDMKKVPTVYIVKYLWTSFKSKLIQTYE